MLKVQLEQLSVFLIKHHVIISCIEKPFLLLKAFLEQLLVSGVNILQFHCKLFQDGKIESIKLFRKIVRKSTNCS